MSKWTLGIVLACMALSVGWADNGGMKLAPVLVLDLNHAIESCEQPTGYVENDEDCKDDDAEVHPDAVETCGNEVDENCDGDLAECGWEGEYVITDAAAVELSGTVSGAGFGWSAVPLSSSTESATRLAVGTASGNATSVFVAEGEPEKDDTDAIEVFEHTDSEARVGRASDDVWSPWLHLGDWNITAAPATGSSRK